MVLKELVKQRDSTAMLRGLVDKDVEGVLEKSMSSKLAKESNRIKQMTLANKKLLHKLSEAQKGVWDLSDRDKAMALHPQRTLAAQIKQMEQPAAQRQLPPGWVRMQDNDGKVYYENHKLHTTSWAFPKAAAVAASEHADTQRREAEARTRHELKIAADHSAQGVARKAAAKAAKVAAQKAAVKKLLVKQDAVPKKAASVDFATNKPGAQTEGVKKASAHAKGVTKPAAHQTGRGRTNSDGVASLNDIIWKIKQRKIAKDFKADQEANAFLTSGK